MHEKITHLKLFFNIFNVRKSIKKLLIKYIKCKNDGHRIIN